MCREMFRILVTPNFSAGKVVSTRLCKAVVAIEVLILMCIATSTCCQLASGNTDAATHGTADPQCSCDLANFNVLPSCAPCNINFRMATKGFAESREVNTTFTMAYPAGFHEQTLGLNVKIVTLRPPATEKGCCDGAYIVLQILGLPHRRIPTVTSELSRVLPWLQSAALNTALRALTRGEISEKAPAKLILPSFNGTTAICLLSNIGLQGAINGRTSSSVARHLTYPQLNGIANQSGLLPYLLRIRAENSSDILTVTRLDSSKRYGHIISLFVNGKRLSTGAKFRGSLRLHVTLRHSIIGSTSYRNASKFFSRQKINAERRRNIFKRTFSPTTNNMASSWLKRCTSSCVRGQQSWASTATTAKNRTAAAENTSRSEPDGRTPLSVTWNSSQTAKHGSNGSTSRKEGNSKAGVSKSTTIISSTLSLAAVVLSGAIALGLRCYRLRTRQFATQFATDLKPSDEAPTTKTSTSDGEKNFDMRDNELYEAALGLLSMAKK